MPGTVDDFVRRFSGQTTMDDRDAAQYYDRFASTHPNDQEFDSDTMHEGATEYLGQLPPQQFQQAASNAFAQAPPQQRHGLLGGLLGALQGRGVDPRSLQSQLGLGSLNPTQMGANDYARLADYTRTNHPDVMQQQVREQPWLVKAMGNPILMGALGVVASRMLRKRGNTMASR
jgi:hypothetical protein